MNEQIDNYLWDPGARPAPEVQALERTLAPLRFEPAARPLALPHRPARPRRVLVGLATAAALVIAAGAGLYHWRLTWPEGRAWTLRAGGAHAPMNVGAPVALPEGQHAIANVARLGTMRVAGGSSLELLATRDRRHRLRVAEGEVHVRVWAPPQSVAIETPSGEVIDLGCEFVLNVSSDRSAVRVLSGWVQLENGLDEVLVPAGASTEMSPTSGPGVPVYDDAAPGFREALRQFEQTGDQAAVARVIELARARDVYSLLLLADNHRLHAPAILARAAQLSPPPAGTTVQSVLHGSREHLWRWAYAQDLPPPKGSWWKNWRDAFPLWLSGR